MLTSIGTYHNAMLIRKHFEDGHVPSETLLYT